MRESNLGTPRLVVEGIVEGINAGDLAGLMALYEAEAGMAGEPGKVAVGPASVRAGLGSFIAMKGKLELEVMRVLEAGGLALVVGEWTFAGTGADGKAVRLAGKSADVLRRQGDGTWRMVIDNPWGVE